MFRAALRRRGALQTLCGARKLGETGRLNTIVGLEVHAQITTQTKLFSESSMLFGKAPNSQVCPYDLAMPGTLPVLNEEAVLQAIRLGLALGCTVQPWSRFVRKHYFYPDLPSGYQITQLERSTLTGGELVLDDLLPSTDRCTVRLDRVQLEQDSGKATHDLNDSCSYLDYNRSNAPLLELVSLPDLRSAAHADAFLRKLSSILRHLRICDAIMAEGSLRCDVNVSVCSDEELARGYFGERIEIKNLSSLKSVSKAIEGEVRRQRAVVQRGGQLERETRSFDFGTGRTRRLRSKESLLDYRFLPDPDLPPLCIDEATVEAVRATLPELPSARGERFRRELKLSARDTGVVLQNPDMTAFFEATLAALDLDLKGPRAAKAAVNWVTNELAGQSAKFCSDRVSPTQLASLVLEVEAQRISHAAGKQILDAMWQGEDALAPELADRLQLGQAEAESTECCVQAVLDAHEKEVQQCREFEKERGKPHKRLLSYLVGQALKKSKGAGNPRELAAAVKRAVCGHD